MAAVTTSKPLSVVLDANVAIAFCAREPGSYAKAKAELEQYAKDGWNFFAPGVLSAEALFVFCKKLAAGTLTASEQAQAVQSLVTLLQGVLPPPNGEASLIQRAEQIRGTYNCKRSSDAIYLALAEELTTAGPAEIVTFDDDIEKQAKANAPSVRVKLLTP